MPQVDQLWKVNMKYSIIWLPVCHLYILSLHEFQTESFVQRIDSFCNVGIKVINTITLAHFLSNFSATILVISKYDSLAISVLCTNCVSMRTFFIIEEIEGFPETPSSGKQISFVGFS